VVRAADTKEAAVTAESDDGGAFPRGPPQRCCLRTSGFLVYSYPGLRARPTSTFSSWWRQSRRRSRRRQRVFLANAQLARVKKARACALAHPGDFLAAAREGFRLRRRRVRTRLVRVRVRVEPNKSLRLRCTSQREKNFFGMKNRRWKLLLHPFLTLRPTLVWPSLSDSARKRAKKRGSSFLLSMRTNCCGCTFTIPNGGHLNVSGLSD